MKSWSSYILWLNYHDYCNKHYHELYKGNQPKDSLLIQLSAYFAPQIFFVEFFSSSWTMKCHFRYETFKRLRMIYLWQKFFLKKVISSVKQNTSCKGYEKWMLSRKVWDEGASNPQSLVDWTNALDHHAHQWECPGNIHPIPKLDQTSYHPCGGILYSKVIGRVMEWTRSHTHRVSATFKCYDMKWEMNVFLEKCQVMGLEPTIFGLLGLRLNHASH